MKQTFPLLATPILLFFFSVNYFSALHISMLEAFPLTFSLSEEFLG